MHKQDTATLNHAAVSERLHTLQLKQWWVARQIGVTPLTVNRWLTGKVRRIGRDNLARLTEVLHCKEDELVYSDETDVRATQVEQTKASRMLSSAESMQMFAAAGQLEVYEQLLKAVMHPNLSVADLSELYSRLCQALSGQNKHDELRDYARRGLNYAVRCGNLERELQFRNNLIVADGSTGKLPQALRGMQELMSTAESAGLGIVAATACVNAGYASRMLGRFRDAINYTNDSLAYLATSDDFRANLYGLSNAGLLALDLGEYELAAELRREGLRRGYQGKTESPATKTQLMLMLVDALRGRKVNADKAWTLGKRLISDGANDEFACWPSIILRFAGEAARAEEYLAQLRTQAPRGPYLEPFLLEEEARVALARRRRKQARELRERANEALLLRGMRGRVCEDPEAEYGQQFVIPARLRLIDATAIPGSIYIAA